VADPVSTIKILTTIFGVGTSGQSVAGSLIQRIRDRIAGTPPPDLPVDPELIPSQDEVPRGALLEPLLLPGIGGVISPGQAALIRRVLIRFGAAGLILGGGLIGLEGLIKIRKLFRAASERERQKAAKDVVEKILKEKKKASELDKLLKRRPLVGGPTPPRTGPGAGVGPGGREKPKRPTIRLPPVAPVITGSRQVPATGRLPKSPAPAPTTSPFPKTPTRPAVFAKPRPLGVKVPLIAVPLAFALLFKPIDKKKPKPLTLPETPVVPSAPPTTTFFPGPATLTSGQRSGSDRCQNVLRRRRRKGKCREGFFEELTGSTKFTTWRTVDCTTRKTIPKKRASK